MTHQSHFDRVLSRPEFIGLVAALMALNALAIDIMLPALPYMGASLGVTNANETEFIVSAYMIGFGVAQLAFGPITDRFGRRAPLFVGIVLYIICAFSATFAPSFTILLCLRFVQGLGAAATRVVAMSVIRDRYSGREMASVMSLAFMTFMPSPSSRPASARFFLLFGTWHLIFIFMTALAALIGIWAWFRLPESLHPEYRRPLTLGVVADGFRAVLTNRMALFYGIAGMLFFSAMFGFIICTQQIFVGIYGLGALFPVAFASIAALMAISNFANSRIVTRFGQRRVSHFAMLVYLGTAVVILALALMGPINFWVYYLLLALLQFVFAWATSNMNSLSMEPLGQVAGTAAAVFGFMQTVGGAIIGTFIGQQFNGTLIPNAAAYVIMGALVVCCVLIAERGRLFGVGVEYTAHTPAIAE